MTETVLFVGGSADGKVMGDSWFPCRKCGIGRFLIRGLCSECAPSLHGTYNDQMDAYSRAADAFKSETGKEPLAVWYEFEEWCSTR